MLQPYDLPTVPGIHSRYMADRREMNKEINHGANVAVPPAPNLSASLPSPLCLEETEALQGKAVCGPAIAKSCVALGCTGNKGRLKSRPYPPHPHPTETEQMHGWGGRESTYEQCKVVGRGYREGIFFLSHVPRASD
jgi:hypothetical protein